jgi:hypothetical protein
MKQTLWMMILCLAFFSACHKADDTGVVDLGIDYCINEDPLVFDTLRYQNEAGNRLMITEIQWFVSRVMLQDKNGEWIPFGAGDNLYYFDTDLPETHHIQSQELPVGHYQAIRFTFGLDEEDNITGRFPNPPESNMFWPVPLGGGYHYMKMNGRWLNEKQELAPFNLHLGTGQNADHTVFYPNHFSVTLPLDLHLEANRKNHLQLTMIIDNWFRTPHTYDLNHFGGAIMQNQEAQQILKENGHDVFSICTQNTRWSDIVHPVKAIMGKAAPKPHFYTKENMKELLSHITHKNSH